MSEDDRMLQKKRRFDGRLGCTREMNRMCYDCKMKKQKSEEMCTRQTEKGSLDVMKIVSYFMLGLEDARGSKLHRSSPLG